MKKHMILLSLGCVLALGLALTVVSCDKNQSPSAPSGGNAADMANWPSAPISQPTPRPTATPVPNFGGIAPGGAPTAAPTPTPVPNFNGTAPISQPTPLPTPTPVNGGGGAPTGACGSFSTARALEVCNNSVDSIAIYRGNGCAFDSLGSSGAQVQPYGLEFQNWQPYTFECDLYNYSDGWIPTPGFQSLLFGDGSVFTPSLNTPIALACDCTPPAPTPTPAPEPTPTPGGGGGGACGSFTNPDGKSFSVCNDVSNSIALYSGSGCGLNLGFLSEGQAAPIYGYDIANFNAYDLICSLYIYSGGAWVLDDITPTVFVAANSAGYTDAKLEPIALACDCMLP